MGAVDTCPDLDLRSPSGDVVDVSGTWYGNDAAYWSFVQVGTCVWATATDYYVNDLWLQAYFRGALDSDFTIPGEFAYAGLERAVGHATLEVQFDATGRGNAVKLVKVAGCDAGADSAPCPPGEAPLQTTQWTRVSDEIILPPPTPQQ